MDKPDHTRAEYVAALPKWKRCRDVVAGQDSVHKAGREYLPELSGQDEKEYSAYKSRANFYGATGRTLDGLVGMVFRKDPDIIVPPAMQSWLDDITLTGITARGFARSVLQEVETVGRVGVLVEYPRVAEQPASLAGALAMNLRPYATQYKAESIINWRIERINNQMMPTLVVLSESYEVRGEFSTESKPQIRALMLVDGVYVQRIYRSGERGMELVEEVLPMRNGAAMNFIPFVMVGSESLGFDVEPPPLLDLVDLNLSHYRTSADLEHGAHFTGLPTPFIAGVQLSDGEAIRIGSATAIVSPHPEATAQYLEFTGQGLGALEKLLDRKEGQMAAIGARMLAPEKAGVEAAEALQLRHSGETSVLAAQSNLVSQAMTKVMQIMADWAGIAGDVSFKLNTDFLPVKMTAQEITALVSAWQSGAISKRTLFWNLQTGEVVQNGKTFETEESELQEEGPTLGMTGDTGNVGE